MGNSYLTIGRGNCFVRGSFETVIMLGLDSCSCFVLMFRCCCCEGFYIISVLDFYCVYVNWSYGCSNLIYVLLLRNFTIWFGISYSFFSIEIYTLDWANSFTRWLADRQTFLMFALTLNSAFLVYLKLVVLTLVLFILV